MIRVSVIGATGYAGVELIRLLLSHPKVKLQNLSSKSFIPLYSVFECILAHSASRAFISDWIALKEEAP